MHSTEILNAADMTTPRTSAALLVWVMRKVKDLSATPETRRYVSSGAKLPTRFYDEIYPLALFVEHEYGKIPDAVVTPNLNDEENFDATVVFKDLHSKVFIQITRAKHGHDESLRLEVLARDGIVPWTRPITKVSGKKWSPKRIVEIHLDVVDRDDELLAKHFSLVETTVKAKAGGRQHGKHFILLVIVDDYDHFQTESDHMKLDVFVRSRLLSADLDFARLIIFGISGKLQLSYRLPRYNQA
jgi:hypothetical protein